MSLKAPNGEPKYKDCFHEALDYFQYGFKRSSTFQSTVLYLIEVDDEERKGKKRIQYLTVKANPPGTEPRVETSLERHPRPDCVLEQSAATFQKVYSGKITPQEVMSMCLSGTIKVHWMRFDVLKGLADSMDFSIERWIRFYFAKGMTWRVKELGDEYLAEVEADKGIKARREEELVLEKLCVEHGHKGFFGPAAETIAMEEQEAAAVKADAVVVESDAVQSAHVGELDEPTWFLVEWEADTDAITVEGPVSTLEPVETVEPFVPPALPEVAVSNMLSLGSALAEAMSLRASARLAVLKHRQHATTGSAMTATLPRIAVCDRDVGWAERAWRGVDAAWIGGLFTPSDSTSLLFRSHHWVAGDVPLSTASRVQPPFTPSREDEPHASEVRGAALPVIAAKAISTASADLAEVSALLGVNQTALCMEYNRLSQAALEWRLLPSEIPGWPVSKPATTSKAVRQPSDDGSAAPIIAASVSSSTLDNAAIDESDASTLASNSHPMDTQLDNAAIDESDASTLASSSHPTDTQLKQPQATSQPQGTKQPVESIASDSQSAVEDLRSAEAMSELSGVSYAASNSTDSDLQPSGMNSLQINDSAKSIAMDDSARSIAMDDSAKSIAMDDSAKSVIIDDLPSTQPFSGRPQGSFVPLDIEIKERQAADVAAAEATVFACIGHSLSDSMSLAHRAASVMEVLDAILRPSSTLGHLPQSPLLAALLGASQAEQRSASIQVPEWLDQTRTALSTPYPMWPLAWMGSSGSGLPLSVRDAASLCTALPSKHRSKAHRQATLSSAPLHWAAPPGLRALVAACGVVVPASLSGRKDAGEVRDARPLGVVVVPATAAITRAFGMRSLSKQQQQQQQQRHGGAGVVGSNEVQAAASGHNGSDLTDAGNTGSEEQSAAMAVIESGTVVAVEADVKDESIFVAPVSAIASLIGLGWDEYDPHPSNRSSVKPSASTTDKAETTTLVNAAGINAKASQLSNDGNGAAHSPSTARAASAAAFVIIWPAAVSDAPSHHAPSLPAGLGGAIVSRMNSPVVTEASLEEAQAEEPNEVLPMDPSRLSDAVLPESAATALSAHSRRLLESMTEMADDINHHSDPIPPVPSTHNTDSGIIQGSQGTTTAVIHSQSSKASVIQDRGTVSHPILPSKRSRQTSTLASKDRGQYTAGEAPRVGESLSTQGEPTGISDSHVPVAVIARPTSQSNNQQPVGRSVFGLASAGPSVGMALGVPLFDDLERSATAALQQPVSDAKSLSTTQHQDEALPSHQQPSGSKAVQLGDSPTGSRGGDSRSHGLHLPALSESTKNKQMRNTETTATADVIVPTGPVVAAGEAVRRALFAAKPDTTQQDSKAQAAAAVATKLRHAAPIVPAAPLPTTRPYQRVSPTPARALLLLVDAVEAVGRNVAAKAVQKAE